MGLDYGSGVSVIFFGSLVVMLKICLEYRLLLQYMLVIR